MSKLILAITLVLLVFGLVVLSSAGIVEGQKKFGSAYYYLNHQLLGVGLGLAAMFILSKIDYKFWKKVSLLVLFLSLLLMVLVFMPSFGYGLKGATRWLNIAGISFQPSELLKLGLILYLAAWFGNRDERIRDWRYGMAPFFVVLSFAGVLLLMQPDIGTLIIISIIAIAMYFFAGSPMKHFLILSSVIVVLFAGMIAVEPYRLDRIKTFIDPGHDPRGISYQLNQSLISIGSGGVFGVGFGKSTQKFGFLPEVTNDSIFAIVAEELGFVGAGFLIGLLVWLALVMVRVANNVADKFGKLLVMGIATWIIGQAFINIAAVSGLVPLTGIPLPFVSYGGTAIVTLLAGMGIVLNVARRA
ncbi:MAG: cell division protein FtsW [Candidatus Yanofskybacteria bacterium RIFCSPHIGHO2_02_FULL_41_29]|uniref:Probable peptidoglycan glycosyltransferase FtsW n=1 Tax=Candidatus Yanofskybacteria bacterium RIFCSPHIGHO2_01_FULL_41_53 TaxID=1802663 RepID=A0A1F8EL81_9BACT|nr:MAG: cell division protein FtsW [Candidatus Yanofskybacteria bacterium RIFCSPHIGHO2_01_FULL_41_53]OGN12269.1 MAG: cell division protein FtsW [Candidatus Yanofskybacteria bacterium RIFCSPHIGHO2_02_FULL_41_29]OGN23632.1 MAG: cell division protein FtsW [Candidatus Yanofskybacteria bacterium RIFCSPLOWO2_01_FULL_41_67]